MVTQTMASKPILTKKKATWAGQFRPNLLRGAPLNHNAMVAERYNKDLQSLVSQMTAQVEREIRKLFEGDAAQEYFAVDESISSQARILTNKLTDTFNSLFARRSKMMASRAVKNSANASKSSLHFSLKELSGGLSIKTDFMTGDLSEVITASIAENVSLIKSISSDYLTEIQGAVMRSLQPGGNGLADLVPYFQDRKEITQRRARNIALDQTRKAYNSINTERLKSIGVKKFEWIHSGGGAHPRREHIKMDGNIYSFDDLPVIGIMYGNEVRGIPGQLPNCRCTMRPVIEFDGDE